ncbi:acyl-CoA dehydrogenase family protein [Mycobacterium sp. CVI_P3]|uniref:Acyl-CoA dehydrogenase family protein n=1 Tax=Mycobacterium pinniadriaticum TaxID=2994102 RepID=A0ABT3SD86_9MYCO|nr:acyl-CoA dehydrogenase family protein [Mycobacterium pinniadriaticum]MCX2930680.1 acyl-CoA dehydrogenase family protein [Mycobacterium pinniadriaticum]MCX2937104.1 acyl-CoA dehydrogenase family protein [Mycobacterium pinniadriaticum]
MTDDVAAVAELARDFFTHHVIPIAEQSVRDGRPARELYRKAGEMGLLCMSIPEAYGGGGGTFAHEAALVTEQTLVGDSSMHLGVHSIIVPHYILAYGSEAQKQRYLPHLASGEWISAIAMTEPGAGSDLQAMTTKAVKCAGGYAITGTKCFISNGLNADVVVLAAKTDPGARGAGISLFVVDVTEASAGSAPTGFSRGAALHKIGQKGQDTAELYFEDFVVPEDAVLGELNTGFKQLKTQLAAERVILGVGAVAAMERAVALTVEYTKQRNVFGAPLLAMQNTRFELAECATLAKVSRTFIDHCIESLLRGELDATSAAMAKYWLAEQQCVVVDRCLQLFGGYGYSLEYPIAQMYADARIQKIYAGANEVMKELIARTL